MKDQHHHVLVLGAPEKSYSEWELMLEIERPGCLALDPGFHLRVSSLFSFDDFHRHDAGCVDVLNGLAGRALLKGGSQAGMPLHNYVETPS